MFNAFKSLFRSKPNPTLQHPLLGELTYEEEIWWGRIRCGEKSLEVTVSGDETGPDARETEKLLAAVSAYSALEKRVFDFIRSQLAKAPKEEAGAFTVRSLDFLGSEKQDFFMVGLSLDGDEDGLWRVEFVDDRSVSWGRDD